MKSDPVITPSLLRELLEYDPTTGKLFWKARDVRFFNNAGSQFIWNATYAGKEAFKVPNFQGYKHQIIFKTSLLAHRVVWAIEYGKWPEKSIDHINGTFHDNRLKNLREADDSVNQRNRVMGSNNTSGYTGVTKNKSGTYSAFILKKRLGTFKTLEEATKARDEAQATTPGFTARHGKPRIVSVGFGNLREAKRAKRAAKKAAAAAQMPEKPQKIFYKQSPLQPNHTG